MLKEVAKHIPMRRELKANLDAISDLAYYHVAKHIPMRRELKEKVYRRSRARCKGRKAHPDEKGTERIGCKGNIGGEDTRRKAHPDEKGTESAIYSILREYARALVAKHIPMRRELKAMLAPSLFSQATLVAKHIPMRRELKVDDNNKALTWTLNVAKHIPMRRELKEGTAG